MHYCLRYSLGDHKVPFSVQSTSKPINYSIALNALGPDDVHKFVGQEPSGRTFNELCLDENSIFFMNVAFLRFLF